MSKGAAILTPHAGGIFHDSRWPQLLAPLRAALEAAGLEVEARSWTGAGDLRPFDLVLPLLAWGYHRDGDWRGQVAIWEQQGVRLRNPARVLGWNGDKSYLQRLGEAGAPVVPTLFVDAISEASVEDAAQRVGAAELILKPRASAGAFQTIRWVPGSSLEGAPDGAAMTQPYLPSIETQGEVSLLYFGGRFSHAVAKVPKAGDFRVQPEHGGTLQPHTPSSDETEAAERVLAAVGEDLLYARVDLARGSESEPLLMEIELIEPDLYLSFDPQAPRRFAAACLEAAR